MSRTNQVVLSCEHAGNRVPPKYRHLFAHSLSMLSSHRGFDIGISNVAKRLARKLRQPLFACYTTRLLIDPNRSLGHPALFSRFSNDLIRREKDRIIHNYYRRYREAVTQQIQKRMQEGRRILHLSLHSFTPILNGQKCNADMGILYDPGRKKEKVLALALQEALSNRTGLRIRRNYPYHGNADGFTAALRKEFGERHYLGIEIEINQALLMGNQSKGRKIADSICLSLDQIEDLEVPL
jgi:predicted N-formylglutamate amidohydrolase